MTVGPTIRDDSRLTVGEIAELAQVGSSAVSNWRRRHSDFPAPVEEGSTGDLFEWGAVRSWLEGRGKQYSAGVSWDEYFWKTADRLRGEQSAHAQLTTWVQLMYLRSASYPDRGNPLLRNSWQHFIQAQDPMSEWQALISEIQPREPDLARALQPGTQLTAKTLAPLLKAFAGVDQENPPDWGELVSSFLSRAQGTSLIGDQSYTPPELARLLVGLAGPISGTVYDPACGVAVTLAEAWRQRVTDEVELAGQEVTFQAWQLAYLHLSLLDARFELRTGDTLRDDQFAGLTADHVVADPPIGLKPRKDELSDDNRWFAGVPRSSADLLWVQQALNHLGAQGRAVVLVAPSSLSRLGSEAEIRQSIIEAGSVETVVELPPSVLPTSSLSPAVLVLRPTQAEPDLPITFIDAKQLGESRRGQTHLLGDKDIDRIVSAVTKTREGSMLDEPRFAATVDRQTVLDRAGVLNPSWYITYATPVREIEGEDIGERLQRLAQQASVVIDMATSAIEEFPRSLEKFSTRGAGPSLSRVRLGDILTEPAATGVRQDEDGSGPAVPFITTDLLGRESALLWPGVLTGVPDAVTKGPVKDRLVSRGDLLLKSRGLESAVRIGCAVVEFDDFAAYSESLIRLRFDRIAAEPGYIRLILTSRQGRDALVAATTGSVISNLRPSALEEIEISLPPLEYQRLVMDTIKQMEADNERLNEATTVAFDAIDTVREGIVGGTLHLLSSLRMED